MRRDVHQHVADRVAAVKQAVASHVAEQVATLQAAVLPELSAAAEKADRAAKAAAKADRKWAERLAAAAQTLRAETAEAVGSARSELAEVMSEVAGAVRACQETLLSHAGRVEAAERAAREVAGEMARMKGGELERAVVALVNETVKRELAAAAAAEREEKGKEDLEASVRAVEGRLAVLERATTRGRSLDRHDRAGPGEAARPDRDFRRELREMRGHMGKLGKCLEERSRDLREMAETLGAVAGRVRDGKGVGARLSLASGGVSHGAWEGDSVSQFDAFMKRMKRRLREAEAEARELRKMVGA